MFRRQKSEGSAASEAPSSSAAPASGKGRPTPTRKEAEAARKARRKPTKNKRQARKQQRKVARAERDASYRAMQTGDESHFPARDQGPVRRYVRDMVDGRRLFTEFFLPVMIVILVMSLLPIPMLVQWMTVLWLVIILLVFFELLWLGLMLRKNIARTFPDDTSKGNLTYGVIRATQLRRLRLPKPAVKPGQPPRT